MVHEYRLFQKSLVLIFLIFIGVIIFALYYAHTKKSGVTGLSMSNIQEMRVNSEKNKDRGENE